MGRKVYALTPGQCAADVTIEQYVRELKRVKASIARLEADEKRLSDLVKQYMGRRTMLFDVTGARLLATYNHSEREGIDLEALKTKFPKTYEKVRGSTPVRTLLIQ